MEIAILIVLILLNGFFALSEISLVSARRSRLERLSSKGSSGARIALKLKEDPENFLSAIQVGITLIGIVTGVYGGVSIAGDVTPFFEKFSLTQAYASEIAMIVTVVIITYVSIVIGELVPKSIGMSNPEGIATKVAPAISLFSKIFFPFVKLLSVSTTLISKLFRLKKSSDAITEAELRYMLKMASTAGIIPVDQHAFHQQAFYFADKKARHIMTHRSEVEWIDLNESDEKIRKQLFSSRHSKLVCAKDSADHILGILYLRDFYHALTEGEEINIHALLEEPLILPEHVPAREVLEHLRKRKVHICVIVDEFGSFEGIITLHDIFEHLIGDIPDEDEEYTPSFHQRDDGSYLVNGDAPVEVLAEIIENFPIDFEKIDYSSVGGFVYAQLNSLPKTGDKFSMMNHSFEIMDMDGKRVDKVLVSRLEPEDV